MSMIIDDYSFTIFTAANGIKTLILSGVHDELMLVGKPVKEFISSEKGQVICVCAKGATYICGKPANRDGYISTILQAPSIVKGLTPQMQESLIKHFLIIAL